MTRLQHHCDRHVAPGERFHPLTLPLSSRPVVMAAAAVAAGPEVEVLEELAVVLAAASSSLVMPQWMARLGV